jgi:hypothetical protein
MILALALSAFPWIDSPAGLSAVRPVPAALGVPVLVVENLKHNLVAIFKMTGATPGRSCGLFVSLTGSGPTTVTTGNCGTLTLDLTPNLFYLGTVNADGTGLAIWTKPIPPNAGGRTIWAQGVSYYYCEVSTLLNEVVQ